jgi:hypothetical protein
LAAFRRKAAVAVEQQPGVSLGDRRKFRDILW